MQETQEMQIESLGWENHLEEELATHFSIPAWKIHEQRSLVGHNPKDCRVGHDWATKPEQEDKHVFAFICMNWLLQPTFTLSNSNYIQIKISRFYIVSPLRYSIDIWNLTFLKQNSQFYAQTLLHSVSTQMFTIYFIAQACYVEVLLDSISFTPQAQYIICFYYPCLQNMCQVIYILTYLVLKL